MILMNWSFTYRLFAFSFLLAEVLLLEHEVIVYKSGSDCRFYVVGSDDEVGLLLRCRYLG
jgi:hypothetical protein